MTHDRRRVVVERAYWRARQAGERVYWPCPWCEALRVVARSARGTLRCAFCRHPLFSGTVARAPRGSS